MTAMHYINRGLSTWAQRAKWSSLDFQSNAACCVDLDANQIELLGHPGQRSMLRSFGRKPN